MENKRKIIHMSNDRKNTINQFKKQYKLIEEIFQKYLIFKKRLQYNQIFNSEEKQKWEWYCSEVEIVLGSLKKIETKFLKEHFLSKKQKDEMFFSTTKYYKWMNISCNNFLTNLDVTFFNLKKQVTDNENELF